MALTTGLSLCTQVHFYGHFVLYELAPDGSPLREVYWSTPFAIAELLIPTVALLMLPRLLLALPAIARDDPHPLSTAWQYSNKIYWALMGFVFIIGIPTTLITRYILPRVTPLALQWLLGVFVIYIPTTLTAIALCFVYQERSRSREITYDLST